MNKNGTNTGHEACPLDAIVNPPCNEVFLMDCMEGMKQYPDKFFDIAIVDPPYGLGYSNNPARQRFENRSWDENIPGKDYFEELFRVSKNQVVWGGNYFNLPATQCVIFWYKQNPVSNFSDGELAWTSFKRPTLCFDYRYYGGMQGKTSAPKKYHPTQKPIALYDWLIKNFAEGCETILDTHVGSGSSRIAAHKAGKSFIGFEIDKDYHEAQEKRFKEFKKQLTLF